ncbi:hypothetical protein ABIA22_001585 [Sinorhizobium fredii]|uniref:flagellar biosynthetic protein FliO n=1 Tax=Rhizobium fredii TaxID=380 RepID=UPI003514B27A
MMETLVGDNGSRFIVAAGAVAIGLLCLVAVLWIMRNRPSSPFVRGGKNRQPRLAVLDAAAVDTRRRLVLVRRDDVEHLIMIGGPTDIVIESRIVPDDAAPAASTGRAASEQQAAKAPVAPVRADPGPQPVTPPAPVETAKIEPIHPVTSDEPARAVPARVPELAPKPEATAPQRPIIAVEPPPRPQPAATNAPPAPDIAPVSTAEPPQGTLSSLRDRIVPMTPPPRDDRVSQPISAAPEPPRPVQTPPAPARPAEPVAVDKSAEFERFLDAEISGDLQRLSPTVAPRPDVRPAAAASARLEPILGPASDDARKEETIEEEMSRMLADISAGRKS